MSGILGFLKATLGQYVQVSDANPLPVAVISGGGGGGGGLNTYTITQTVHTVTTGSTTLIGANPSRKFLAWMVIGTQDVTIAPASPAVLNAGQIYAAGGDVNKQGASEEFSNGCPTNAFYCIAVATGSNIVVWEGA